MTIRTIRQNKERFLPLLLDADPDAGMIHRYLNRGTLYAMEQEGEALCLAVMVRQGKGCELKNLVTAPAHRRKGYAGTMLRFLFRRYRRACGFMLVGTSETMVPYYEGFGFRYVYTLPNFFIRNYPDPIFENERQVVDMLMLRKGL